MNKGLQLTEEAFSLLLLQNNDSAFNYIYDKYAPLLFGIILQEVKDEEFAAEILKFTFITISKECRKMYCCKKPIFPWILLLLQETAKGNFNIRMDFKSFYFKTLPSYYNMSNNSTIPNSLSYSI